jgi:hypothetical protein
MKNNPIRIANEMIGSLISAVGIQNFAVGLNNSLCHGDALVRAGYHITDEQLGDLFKGVDAFLVAAKNIEKENN